MPPQSAAGDGDNTRARRRETVLLVLTAGVLAVIVWVAIGVGGSDTSGRDALSRRLELGVDPQSYSFTYERGGTRALDCLQPNLRYMAEVDTARGQMVVRGLGRSSRTIALASVDQVWVHRSLFDSPPFETPWLVLPRAPSPSVTAAVQKSLGTDLASTLLGDGLPPNGSQTVRAALDIARTVDRIEPITIGDSRADGFRLEVDPAGFADAAPLPEGGRNAATEASELLPVLDAWVTLRGEVVRLAVRPVESDGTFRPPEEGWHLDFGASDGVNMTEPAHGDTTDASSVDTDELRPSKMACRLPI